MALITLANGRVIDTEADDVAPEDLVTGAKPVDVPGTITSLATRGVGETLAPDLTESLRNKVSPLADDPVPAQAAPAVAQNPAVPAMPSAPLVAPKKPTGAGGGGGGTGQEARLQGDLTRVQGEQEKALEGEAGVNREKAVTESSIADAAVKRQQAEQVRMAEQKQAAEAEHARLSANADAEDKKYKSMGFQDFWSHASIMGKPNTVTGARVLGLIGMALGAAGASLTGGRNYAMEQIDKLIANDYQRQRDSILKQRDAVSEARGLAKEAKADKLIALENWRKNAYELAELEAKAQLAKMGPAAADAKKASAIAELHEKKIESKLALDKGIAQLANTRADTVLKYAEAQRARTAGATGKQPSGGELGAAADASSILSDLEQIGKLPQLTRKDLEKVNSNRTLLQTSQAKGFVGGLANVGGKLTGIVPNSETEGLAPEKQQAYLAWQNVRSAMAHVLTGAGMSDSEREDYIRRYTPQPGDSDQTVAGKFVTARQFVKDQLIKAGRAAAPVQQRLNQLQAPPTGSLPPGAIRGTMNGKRGYALNGQFYSLEGP